VSYDGHYECDTSYNGPCNSVLVCYE